MKLIPIDSFRLKTKLSAEEVFTRLNSFVEPGTPLVLLHQLRNEKEYYIGVVEKSKFSIQRQRHPKNHGSPLIKGIIIEDLSETVINIKLQLNYYSIFFLTLWVLMLGSFLKTTIEGGSNLGVAVIFGFLLLGYIFTIIMFNSGASDVKEDLQKELDAQIIPNDKHVH
jgi:hypothetical protein